MSDTKIVSDEIVDRAYDAAGGLSDPSPITWVRMRAALEAVAPAICNAHKVPDLTKATEYLERMRRLIENCPDDYTRDNLRLIFTDLQGELSQ